jgi:vancomycin aglycone glucosyltransferase
MHNAGTIRGNHCSIRTAYPARSLGRRTFVSRGWADLALVDDPPDCLAIGEVNQQAFFRRVASVVHHGGAGTTTAAALAGAPQVVIPQVYDQYYWARRVHDLGIGIAHAGSAPSTDSLTVALEPRSRLMWQCVLEPLPPKCGATVRRSPRSD